MLTGLYEPTAGDAMIFGRSVTREMSVSAVVIASHMWTAVKHGGPDHFALRVIKCRRSAG